MIPIHMHVSIHVYMYVRTSVDGVGVPVLKISMENEMYVHIHTVTPGLSDTGLSENLVYPKTSFIQHSAVNHHHHFVYCLP